MNTAELTDTPLERPVDGRPLYTLYPVRRGEDPGPLPEDAGLVLSRFAVIHREGTALLVESPRAPRLRRWSPFELWLHNRSRLARESAAQENGAAAGV
ncbi:hypothetical protein SAMN05192558_11410 [Actinokineospora alba]|uniref:Uncharacterized protein n=1 Tax=Actinokineospora alba TaxID=504798 RepID=A0A1H0VG64_9PSEU|nr:hypothetical protein [Actinokineospora alba]SDJ26773.1 hypothetical protein SAMN05421871_11210 [Actinokineospora alba]SDP77542.1 hypothetical protein SAMN05192558_11410 [Actinokineospora alba]